MPNPEVSIFYSSQLVGLTVARGQIPEPMPLNISPWVAMSLLQKAIRRGAAPVALSVAATLLRDAPERLWRRLGCIAFEDIGVADIACLGLVTTALTGKAFRKRLGGEWAVASLIIQRMSDVHADTKAGNTQQSPQSPRLAQPLRHRTRAICYAGDATITWGCAEAGQATDP
tara:strand:- start:920 stop:1435 length:516 start_codon:yes stop_codon:yes gene_type:complete